MRRAAPFAGLPRSALEATLDMLAGRYPSDAFAELRPRLVWDRVTGELTARRGAQRLAVTSGGTIPDRGLFGVFLASGEGPGRRVGELDEEMVYESRVGDVFLLGSSSWRIEDITHDRVLVTPAPGQIGRMPFWKGDSPGRPVELGRALGAFLREVAEAEPAEARARAQRAGLDEWGADNLLAYLDRAARSDPAPARRPHRARRAIPRRARRLAPGRALAVRRAGQRAVGAGDRRPTARAVRARRVVDALRRRHRAAAARHRRRGARRRSRDLRGRRDRGDDHRRGRRLGAVRVALSRVRRPVAAAAPPRSAPAHPAVAAAPAREPTAAGRLRVRRVPGRARGDARVPAGRLRRPRAGRAHARPRVAAGQARRGRDTDRVAVRPVAAVRLRRHVPVRGRRAAGRAPRAGAVARLRDAGRTARRHRTARTARRRRAGRGRARGRPARPRPARQRPRRRARPAARGRRPDAPTRRSRAARPPPTSPRSKSRAARSGCASPASSAGSRSRTPAGCATPSARRFRSGCPRRSPSRSRIRSATWSRASPARTARSTRPTSPPVSGSASRSSRPRSRGWPPPGGVVQGEFRPDGVGTEWCDAEVLRMVRRRSLAALRKEVEPVPPAALARFIPSWQGVGARSSRGVDGVLRAVEQLAGVPVPASALESLILPARVADYAPTMLDELTLAGEVVWTGAGALAGNDGWVVLAPAEVAPLLLPPLEPGRRDWLRRCSARSSRARRCSSARWPIGAAGRAPTTTSRPPSGSWSGPARSPTTRSRRCARGSTARRRTAHARRPRAPRTRYGRYGGLAGIPTTAPRAGRAVHDGRTLVGARRRATSTRPGARWPPPTRCSTGTAW